MGIKSNNLAASFHDFFSRSGKDAVKPYVAPVGLQASGGNIADGNQPGNGWTYHVFTQPGTFTVSSGSGTVQYVIIGGGGGGGNEDVGGGGGAGALATGSVTVSSPQPITVGQGGAGSNQGSPAPNGRGANGGDTIFGALVTANGGGGGGSGNYNQPNKPGSANGNASGGGGGWLQGAGGGGGSYGHDGGNANTTGGGGSTNAGGGGGAGGVGETMPNTSHTRTAAGGDGAPAGPGYNANLNAFTPMPATWKSVVGPTGVFAGGGGGGADGGPDTTAPAPGGGGVGDSGGCFGPDRRATQGLDNTGSGGGGGGGCSSGNYPGQPGGDGIVILRHQGNQLINYTTRGIIFDYDPGLLSFSDGTTLNNSSVLEGGLVSGNNLANTTVDCSQGSLTYKTANGGYVSGESSAGIMLAGGTALQQALDACQSITLTCWFYHPADARHALMSRYGTGWTNQFNHFIDPNGELHYNYTGAIANTAADINTNVFSANTWTLSHNTYDVSTGVAKWYMNGQDVATANLGTDSGNGLTVSSSSAGQGFAWMSRADYYQMNDGRMGKVRIHNVALTAQECLNDFNFQKSIYGL